MIEQTPEEIQRQKVRELFRRILNALNAAVKNAMLYDAKHPSVDQAASNLAGLFQEAHTGRMELEITHADGIFIIDNELFIEESMILFELLSRLEENGIRAVNFLAGVNAAEAKSFVLNILEKRSSEDETLFHSEHIRASGKTPDVNLAQGRGARLRRLSKDKNEWIARATGIFQKLLDEQSFSLAEHSDALEKTIDLIQVDPETNTLTLLEPHGHLHLDHAVNSLLLSIQAGISIGLDAPTLKLLGVCGLLHDIGRFLLPSDFQSGYALTQEDVPFVQLHARDGAAFLAGVPGLPTSVVRVALEHHLGFDGIGYPTLPSGHKPHLFSQIVGLVDFLSWKTVSDRHYHRPMPLHRLIRSLLRRTGSQFDPTLVKTFLPAIGLFPPGTAVQLNTGETAVSIESNVRNLIRPAVVVLRGSETREWSLRKLTDISAEGAFASSATSIRGWVKDLAPFTPFLSETPIAEN